MRVFKILCTDILGPIKRGMDDERYVVNFVDDYSKHMVTFPVRNRTEVADSLRTYIKKAESTFLDVKIKSVEYGATMLESYKRFSGRNLPQSRN